MSPVEGDALIARMVKAVPVTYMIFDVLYAEGEQSGRLFGLTLHPYLVGHAAHSRWLDKILPHISIEGSGYFDDEPEA